MGLPRFSGAAEPNPVAPFDFEREQQNIESWRHHCLTRAGYPVEIADGLAVNFDVDLHEAVALVKRGCPPELAAEILL